MAGVAERARFYLERSVPQLREWEEKEIFSKEEIRTIVQKRNEYEHNVLSPGNSPKQWSAYAKWEQTLEKLRNKRCRRLKVNHLNSAYAGQSRVLSIYRRAVNKHPGSGALWREYLSFAASIKAAKRWRKTMTSALRMMPHDVDLWVMAGRRSAKNGDMASARGFFMRGCRFCNKDCTIWLEYARSEMEWLLQVDKRKETKGVNALRPDRVEDEDELRIVDSDDEDEDDEDGNNLPQPSKVQARVIDEEASKQLKSNPAQDGAIPLAIFDIARKQPFFSPDVGEAFFVMFASFRTLTVQPKISQHVMESMNEQFPAHPATDSVYIRQPIAGIRYDTAEFPHGLRDVLARLTQRLESTSDKADLCRRTVSWMDEYLALNDLDEAIRQVLERVKGKLEDSQQ